MILQATELQLSKARITPNGRSGDVLTVGVGGITDISIIGSTAIISYVRDGSKKRFLVRDYLHAKLADEQPKEETESNGNDLSCEKCGGSFKGPQALAGHRKHCNA